MSCERDRFGCFLAACSPSKMLSETNQPVLRLKALRFRCLRAMAWPQRTTSSTSSYSEAHTASLALPVGLGWLVSYEALAKPLTVLSRSSLHRHPYHKAWLV